MALTVACADESNSGNGNNNGNGNGNGNGSEIPNIPRPVHVLESSPGACALGAYNGTDNVPASASAPCNIPPEKTPMFVALGFDDNGNVEGLRWALDMLKARGATATFFNTTEYGSNAAVLAAWKEAAESGHEIGNHTVTHLDDHGGHMFTVEQWTTEIGGAHDFLMQNGFAGKLFGFRTPYLETNDAAIGLVKQLGYWYDCSLEEGYQDTQDGKNFFFPYTLDNASPGHDLVWNWVKVKGEVEAHPGLWELPVYAVISPPDLRASLKMRQDWFDEQGGKITGFDYNLWARADWGGFQMTKDEFLATLKHSFDLRMQGNRAPFLFGAHTDYYVSSFDSSTGGTTTAAERREAIEEFLNYVLSKPEVLVVSYKQVLDWMRNPKPL